MNGGTGTFTFTGTPSGSINTNNGTVTATSLQPGTYTSTETVASGWALSNIACTAQTTSTITIGASARNGGANGNDAGDGGVGMMQSTGDDFSGTFTNTKNGSITIKKVMQGGTGTFTFTGTPSGSINTNNGTVSATALQPGTYTSTETVASGWVLTNIGCTGQTTSTITIGASGGFDAGDTSVAVGLAAGEDVTCTFTNTKNGSITIKKVMQGGTGSFTFTGSPNGTISTNNGTVSATGLLPGTYTSTETVASGWVLSNIGCTGQTTSTITIGASGGFDAGGPSLAVGLADG